MFMGTSQSILCLLFTLKLFFVDTFHKYFNSQENQTLFISSGTTELFELADFTSKYAYICGKYYSFKF